MQRQSLETAGMRRVHFRIPAEAAKEREKELFEEIGRLRWSGSGQKRVASSSVEERRRMIEPKYPTLPITWQCELLMTNSQSFGPAISF